MSFLPSETNTQLVTKAPVQVRQGERTYRRVKGVTALFQSSKSAGRSLRSNILRSLLTSLGIIIGVGAVIMMISISEGNAASINQRLSALNPLQLTIRPGSAAGPGNVRQGAGTQQLLTQNDADALAQLPNVTAVSPVINTNGQLVFGSQNWASRNSLATLQTYLLTVRRPASAGLGGMAA